MSVTFWKHAWKHMPNFERDVSTYLRLQIKLCRARTLRVLREVSVFVQIFLFTTKEISFAMDAVRNALPSRSACKLVFSSNTPINLRFLCLRVINTYRHCAKCYVFTFASPKHTPASNHVYNCVCHLLRTRRPSGPTRCWNCSRTPTERSSFQVSRITLLWFPVDPCSFQIPKPPKFIVW